MRRAATMLRRGASRSRFPADRYFTVADRLAVYRQIGRRPSQVYVDDMMKPAGTGLPERRLFDAVFWRSHAEIGDQIEVRASGLLLLTAVGECYPIQLSAPRMLEIATAFGHADARLRDDRNVLEVLLAEGSVVEASPRRSKTPPSRLPDSIFDEAHPLVVTIPPSGADRAAGPNSFGPEPG